MLVGAILAYLAASIAVGLFAATRVRGAADYAIAGKRFGMPVVAATVFATWFGAETVLGIPATFQKEGLRGLVADPFAAMGCLVLVGLVFARPLHRSNVLTLGDLFRERFGRGAEVVLSLCIAFSYLGWGAAQLVALGLAFNVLSGGAIDTHTGILLGFGVVLVYTMAGGMWSVALTDLLQTAVILVGLLYVAWVFSGLAGGAGRVFDSIAPEKLALLPEADARSILAWISAAFIVLLGSVPQQDVLQRVKSARDEATAVRASVVGGVLYFFIASIPIFLVSAAALIDPPMVARRIGEDYQLILPTIILERTPFLVQALFFGALVSAILSTAGATLLAPAVTLAENVIRPWTERRGRAMEDARLLWTMRFTVLAIGAGVLAMALASKQSIYELVNESGKVVLVSSFVPLVAALFFPRASARGAHLSIGAGLVTWIAMELAVPEFIVPPPLAGLAASLAGMLAGTRLAPRPPA